MKNLFAALIGGTLAAGCLAQAAPSSASAASAPATAASRFVPVRNAAALAAENAKEPGAQRPEERVTPQISLPLRNRAVPTATGASAPVGSGTVNDGAARCLAAGSASQRAACERRLAASASVK